MFLNTVKNKTKKKIFHENAISSKFVMIFALQHFENNNPTDIFKFIPNDFALK